MPNKKRFHPIYILIIILAVLIAVFFIYKTSQEEATKQQIATNYFLNGFKAENIAKIVVNPPEGKKGELSKLDNAWVVADQGNYPANEEVISNILSALGKAVITETVSNNPNNFAKFDVTNKGIIVKMSDTSGHEIFSFLVGKTGPNYTDCYVKIASINSVYLINQNLNSLFNQKDWISPYLANLDPKDIKDLTVYQKNKPTYRFERIDGSIQLAFPAESNLNQTIAEQYFTNLAKMKTNGVLFKAEQPQAFYGLAPETALSYKINLTKTDGTTLTYRFGKEDQTITYAQIDGNPTIFKPAIVDVAKLEVKLKDLIIVTTK